jgi:hypothetical protein
MSNDAGRPDRSVPKLSTSTCRRRRRRRVTGGRHTSEEWGKTALNGIQRHFWLRLSKRGPTSEGRAAMRDG